MAFSPHRRFSLTAISQSLSRRHCKRSHLTGNWKNILRVVIWVTVQGTLGASIVRLLLDIEFRIAIGISLLFHMFLNKLWIIALSDQSAANVSILLIKTPHIINSAEFELLTSAVIYWNRQSASKKIEPNFAKLFLKCSNFGLILWKKTVHYFAF